MTWNYRIVKYANHDALGLHEVYYNENGVAEGMTEKAMIECMLDEGVEGIIHSLETALKDAKERPIFNEPKEWDEKSKT